MLLCEAVRAESTKTMGFERITARFIPSPLDVASLALRECNSNAIEIRLDLLTPLHSSASRPCPKGTTLKLDDITNFEGFLGEDAHTTLTKIKSCTLCRVFRLSRNHTRHAHTKSSLVYSSLFGHLNHRSA